MTHNGGNRFIPSFVLLFAVYAVVTPYIAILIRDLGYSPFYTGILLGIFEGAGIIGPFILGYIADRMKNYRTVMLISFSLPAAAAFPLVLFVHPFVSAVMLALMAFGLRSSVPLCDSVTTIQLGSSGNYGSIRVWGSISFIFVTLFLQLTPFLQPVSAINIAAWTFFISFASIIPVVLYPKRILDSAREAIITETNVHDKTEKPEEKTLPFLSLYVLGGFLIIFFSRMAMPAINSYYPLYITEILNWNIVGLIFAAAAFSEVPFMFLSGRLIRRYGAIPLLAISAAAVTLRLLIYAFLPYKPFIIASQLLHSLCFGLYHPAAVFFITTIFPERKRGMGMSLFFALGSGLPILIGTVLGGAIIERFGYVPLFVIFAGISALSIGVYGVMGKIRQYKINS